MTLKLLGLQMLEKQAYLHMTSMGVNTKYDINQPSYIKAMDDWELLHIMLHEEEAFCGVEWYGIDPLCKEEYRIQTKYVLEAIKSFNLIFNSLNYFILD